jgi:hypothetical protein
MKKWIVAAALGILGGIAVGWAFHRVSKKDPPPAERTHSSKQNAHDRAPAQQSASDADDAGIVQLSAQGAQRMGLAVATLLAARHAREKQASAIVLSPQGLAAFAGTYVTDTRDLAQARVNLGVTQKEYRRQEALYRANQTTSLKSLQAAQAAVETNRAQVVAALRQLQLDRAAMEEQWGGTVAQWLAAGSPQIAQILEQKEWLVEVTLTGLSAGEPARWALFTAPGGATAFGRYVSSFPQSNPVIQGLNFLYVIPARPGFARGLTLVAELPDGRLRSGVVVPESAAVWANGQAWAYKETGTNRFERLRIATEEPVSGGWFVTSGFAAGDRVVIRGAEELYSTETQAAGGGSADGDD